MSERRAGPRIGAMVATGAEFLISVNDMVLTEAEREEVAVFVACRRRDWFLSNMHSLAPWLVLEQKGGVAWEIGRGDTPNEAYAAALRATEDGDE